MKLKNIIFLIMAIVFGLCSMDCHAQQTILIFSETFENYNGSFNLNVTGNGADIGDNQWIINDEYNGQNIYPNTIRQDSVISGTITNAPFSSYLHIHDAASGITNANYNTNNSSDRFTHTDTSFCTLGLTDVTLDFFYLAEGTADSYGEFYFSINGSAWQQGGQTKYFGQPKWKQERITNVAFDNVSDLRFGFRWVNDNAGGITSTSFSIDDIVLTGNYDDINIAGQTTVCMNSTSGYRVPFVSGASYEWTAINATVVSTSGNEVVVAFNQQATAVVAVSITNGCVTQSDSLTVEVIAAPEIFAGNDTVVCLGGSVPINAVAQNNFTWRPIAGIENPNLLQTVIKPEASTLYTLETTDPNTGCTAKDSLFILVTTEEGTVENIQFCMDKEKELALPHSANNVYLWSSGETTQSLLVNRTATYIGQYTKDNSGCIGKIAIDAEAIDCDKIIQTAEAFTPKNDGVNDYFTVFGKNVTEYEIRIFNRWGEEVYYSNDVFELNDLSRGWNGTHKGKLQNTAVFVYYITAKDINGIDVERKGNLTLIR